MKATPRITADFEEYPELRILADVAIRRVVELMQVHDIAELRRIRKTGVYDRPYVKDVVTPIGLPTPSTISASRYAVGQALLGYLETVGIEGISLEISQEDAAAISALWQPPQAKPAESSAPGKEKSVEPVKENTPEGTSIPAKTNKRKEHKQEQNQGDSKNGKTND